MHDVEAFLIHSYLYYELDENIIVDTEYDLLAKRLLDNWEAIEHEYKHLIIEDDLRCGSGFNISIPKPLKQKARLMLEDHKATREVLQSL